MKTYLHERSVMVKVGDRVYRADSPFNLRNLILSERNALEEAVAGIERQMEAENDPMFKHITPLHGER